MRYLSIATPFRHGSRGSVRPTPRRGLTPLGQAASRLVLPKNSVRAAQIKKSAVSAKKLANNAVSSAKVKDGSLLTGDFKAGQLPAGPKVDPGPRGPMGDAGPRGLQGIQGQKGDKGDPGLSRYQVVLSAGQWLQPGADGSGVDVKCPVGKRVIGGGASGNTMYTTSSMPDGALDGWFSRVKNVGPIASWFWSFAICAYVK